MADLNTATQQSKSGNGSDDLRDQIATLRRDLSELTETVRKQAKNQLGETQERAAAKVDEFEDEIRRKPITAAAIAAGVGFLIGAIISR